MGQEVSSTSNITPEEHAVEAAIAKFYHSKGKIKHEKQI